MDTQRRGLTLVEYVIVGWLLALTGSFLVQVAGRFAAKPESPTTVAEMQTQAQLAVDGVAEELRAVIRAEGATAPTTVVPPAPGNTWLQVNGADPVQFQFDPAAQQMVLVRKGVSKVLVGNVTEAVFEDRSIDWTLMPKEVRIKLTIRRANRGRPSTATATALVPLKN